MRRIWSTGTLAAAMTVGAAGIVHGETTGSDVDAKLQAMQARIDQQEKELNELRNKQGEDWLNARRAEEVKALVRGVLSDADTRASLADNPVTAGHDKSGFFLASEDGNFRLNIGGQIQVRYIANFRNDANGTPSAPTSPADNGETGFQIRRAKLDFNGWIGSPKFLYRILLAANRDSGTVEIEDAWVAYDLMPNIRLQGGRFQDYFAREQMNSSKRQLTVERSVISQIFAEGDGFTEGFGAIWKACDFVTVSGSVNDGLNSGTQGGTSTGFLNGGNDFNNDATDVAFTGRAEFKVMGDWKQADDFSSWQGDSMALFAGIAAHYEIGESGDKQGSAVTGTGPGFAANAGPYDNFFNVTSDINFQWNGLSVFAAGFFQSINGTDANPHGNLTNWGAMGQVGYFVVPDKLQPFFRYEWIRIDHDVATDDLSIVTAGANYYFAKHAAKFTLDAVWCLAPVTAANTLGFSGSTGTGFTGLGILADAAGRDNQVVIRAQFQLLF